MAWNKLIKRLDDFEVFLRNYSLWYDGIRQEDLDWILKVIQERIKSTGQDASGDLIGTYSLFTASLNPEKAYNTPYTLDDTGAYYRQRFIWKTADAIITMSKSASYVEMMEQPWWSNDIERLNDSEKAQFREIVKKNIIDDIKKAWKKGR